MASTLWQRLFRGTCCLHQQPDWAELAGPGWAECIMATAVTDRLHTKQGRSIGRWVLEKSGRRLVVYLKRHYRLPRWRGWLATLFPRGHWSPAMQEWDHLVWAQSEGFPVPRAVAGGEFIGPWGRLQSFLAVEELTGMLPLHEAIPLAATSLDSSAFRLWKQGLIGEMATLVRALHHRHCFHKDLYLCHFYLAEEDTQSIPPAWRGRLRLIDLHRLGRHPWTWPWWQTKDLAQLLYSSEVSGVTSRDRLLFWRAYHEGRRRWSDSWLRWWIRTRSWSYRRHNRRRRLTVPAKMPLPIRPG